MTTWLLLMACVGEPTPADHEQTDTSTTEPTSVPTPEPTSDPDKEPFVAPNFLVVLADDHGVDWVGAYDEFVDTPRTPQLDAFADEGLLFRRAYSAPTCGPTRAALLTGRFGFRNELGMILDVDSDFVLDESKPWLPAVLDGTDPSYTNAMIGKWHLGLEPLVGHDHPLRMGFDEYAGSWFGVYNYSRWPRIEDGEQVIYTDYPTIVTADAAVDALGRLPEPWFLMVAFNAPHEPFHEPPAALHSYDLDGATDKELYAAMVEALDAEFGRVLDAMTPEQEANTFVMYLGDNGTMRGAMQPIETPGGKNSVRETGIRVPWIVRGPGVPAGTETAAMVQVVDLIPTLAELAGAEIPADLEPDGESFAGVLTAPEVASGRDWIYAERFVPNGPGPYDVHRQSVRNDRFKVIRNHDDGTESLYDLLGRTREGAPIEPPYTGDAAAAYAELVAILDGLR